MSKSKSSFVTERDRLKNNKHSTYEVKTLQYIYKACSII